MPMRQVSEPNLENPLPRLNSRGPRSGRASRPVWAVWGRTQPPRGQRSALCVHTRKDEMNPHTYLLAFLIGSAITRSPALSAQPPIKHVVRCSYRNGSSPLTRMQARRGGKGRRRGRKDGGGLSSGSHVSEGAGAVSAKESPSTAAASATLAVQHASHHELLGVAHTHKAILRPGVLSQALLRIAKVCHVASCPPIRFRLSCRPAACFCPPSPGTLLHLNQHCGCVFRWL